MLTLFIHGHDLLSAQIKKLLLIESRAPLQQLSGRGEPGREARTEPLPDESFQQASRLLPLLKSCGEFLGGFVCGVEGRRRAQRQTVEHIGHRGARDRMDIDRDPGKQTELLERCALPKHHVPYHWIVALEET